ncbi:hypothetical protein PGTUg99_020213 [Puccinia graminis f. sp. tritici]|uniref:Uncharacterized protein n=1 Tax=Puccinia graminis f. sp. tritici TaxID=56615 RepID=A0A5B0PWI8_PUCGR|nr:hypothetical protein PGTUg99_020213 [Puccinia graminis f. sp. tritici]
MYSARSLGALLLGAMPLIQNSFSLPLGGPWESSHALGSGRSSSAHEEMSHGHVIRQIMKKSHLVQPRSAQDETISQQLSQILGSSSLKDPVPLIELPEPKEKPNQLLPPPDGLEKAGAADAAHKPQDKYVPDTDEGSPANQNTPIQKDNGQGHEPNNRNPPHFVDNDDSSANEPQSDKKPQSADDPVKPHGDDQHLSGAAAGPPSPAHKEGEVVEHPPSPAPTADPHGQVDHSETHPLSPLHPAKGDEHTLAGPHGPKKAKSDRTQIAAVTGIHIERVDTIIPASVPAHPPAPAGLNVHDELKAKNDHPLPPPAATTRDGPKENPPTPAVEHIREAGVYAIRITSDKLKIEVLF